MLEYFFGNIIFWSHNHNHKHKRTMKNHTTPSFLKKHQKKALQLYNKAYNNFNAQQVFEANEMASYFRNLGIQYLDLIFFKANTTYPKKAKPFLNQLDKDLNVGELQSEFLIGFACWEELNRISQIKELEERIRRTIESMFPSENNSNTYETFYSMQEEEKQKSHLKYVEKTSSKIDQSFSLQSQLDCSFDLDLSIEEPENVDYNSNYIKNQILEVRQYLNKLSKATSQLSHLCQHMKWTQPIFDENRTNTKDNLFEGKATVYVKVKENPVAITGVCPQALSKRQARRVASLLLLRKIYNHFPNVWNKFKMIRSLKTSTQQPLDSDNEHIFNKMKLNQLDIGMFEEKESEDTKLQKQISQYLSKIQSFKSEVNILLGRYKELSPPKFTPQPQDELGLWPIVGQMLYKKQVFKAKAKEAKKKEGQEKCCKELLFQFYKKHKDIWMEFKEHKNQKKL